MNKILKSAILVLSASALSFACACSSCSSCKKDEDPFEYEEPNYGTHGGTAEKNDDKYFSDGKSDYTIVVPDSATSMELMAASELEYFFRMSTDYSLASVSESEYGEGKYFSIGKTSLLDKSGIEVDDSELGNSGFLLKNDDDGNVYFAGSANGFGSLYAVYEFLSYAVGYEYYAADEYSVKTLSTVEGYNFDIKEIPIIQRRGIDTFTMVSDMDYATRLRLNGMGTSAYTGVHTELQIMPYTTYGYTHPEWYSNGGLHLCYSADGLFEEFVKNIKDRLIEKPTADYVNLGLSDNNSFCTCDKCNATAQQYGTQSAVMLLFMNRVVKDINQWLAENYPGRDVQFLMLAYQRTVDAPVTENSDGTLTPNAPELMCEDNLGIYIADAGIDYSKRLDSERNIPRLTILRKWATLSKKLYIYTYATNFNYFPCSFPNYLAFEDNYTLWGSCNVECINETGNHNCPSLTFDALRNYLMSKFMWNSGLNYLDTVKEFMGAYYKEAGDAMYDYYTKLSSWQQYLNDTGNGDYGYLYYSYTESEWPKYILDGFHASIKQAYKAIEPLKGTDNYNKLYERIKIEELSVVYMYMSWYSGAFTRDEKQAMVDDFEYYCNKFGVTRDLETFTSTMQDTINNWRLAL